MNSRIDVPTFSEPGLVPWACVDIETCDGSPDRIIPFLRRSWSEGASKKPEVIGQRFLDAALREEDKLAILPWAPIILVQLYTPRGAWAFHCMGSQPTASDVPGAVVHAADNPRDMLMAFRAVCDGQIGAATEIVGHNIRGFDLPRLRRAFVSNHVHMPAWLGRSDQPVFDSMRIFASAWAGAKHDDDSGRKRKMFASLDDVCDDLGLDRNDSPLCEAAIPEAYREGRFAEIVNYGLRDVLVESRVYLAMTGLTREYLGLDLFSDADRAAWQ